MFRARTDTQRGFALLSALVLAALYFALMQLLLVDASRGLAEARRFRAKVVAESLAESAAEIAAADICNRYARNAATTSVHGTMQGSMSRQGVSFRIEGSGTAAGPSKATASVTLYGRVEGTKVSIDYAMHTP